MREELAGHEDCWFGRGSRSGSDSSEWRSEPHLVRKPGGGKKRFTGDYKASNASLAEEAYPMPNIIQEAEKLIGPEPAEVLSSSTCEWFRASAGGGGLMGALDAEGDERAIAVEGADHGP